MSRNRLDDVASSQRNDALLTPEQKRHRVQLVLLALLVAGTACLAYLALISI